MSCWSSGDAFVPSGQSQRRIILSETPKSSASASSLSAVATDGSNGKERQDMVEMRADIARMREEAMKRLEALNQKFQQVEELQRQQRIQRTEQPFNPVVLGDEHASDPRVKELVNMAEDFDREMQPPISSSRDAEVVVTEVTLIDGEIVSDSTSVTSASLDVANEATSSIASSSSSYSSQKSQAHPLKLLDNTRWRLMLNVGREPGTWMPKTWGISGDRLYLNLEMEFTEDHLYERDEFFNGVSGSKVLHIIHNEGNLAPSMLEGGRRVRIRDGGWRVVPNEGPMGTTVLRFYFDLEEETRHQGSDVYLPSGRVYCTCGYFPMAGRSGAHGEESTRETLEKELRGLEVQYEKLSSQMELDDSLFSLDKLKRAKDMMDIRVEAERIGKAVQTARVREPDRSLLRLSQDQSVGLTREGGVCCKKQKGVAVEYHILGHFEIASIPNREHGDYRELLP
ncbi:hypothetical protein IV203_012420 [Nitzschia inconspicua]|uniref:Uncharacterized protein n=1 Tax=Nitzschia inconspicua TaxID=303405 RepID=A0A9K3KTT9_9STRA|nr:hypothetical protein IV203_012420 [Nitzschia inconspicua]